MVALFFIYICTVLDFVILWFSYPKVTDVLTSCLIGTRITLPHIQDTDGLESIRDVFPFFGQIGPVYLFNDSLSSEQVQAIYALGPSYMYAFLENEMTGPFSDNPFSSGILDGKDGLASKVSFGLNAQVIHPFKQFFAFIYAIYTKNFLFPI